MNKTNVGLTRIVCAICIFFSFYGCASPFNGPYDPQNQGRLTESFYRIGIYGISEEQAAYDTTGVLAFFNNFFLSSKQYQSLEKYVKYPSYMALREDFNNGSVDIAVVYNPVAIAEEKQSVTVFVNPLTLSESDKIFISDSLEYMGLGAGVYVSYWNKD